ncbi:MAG: c-type cytochrome [Cyanobium sp.]
MCTPSAFPSSGKRALIPADDPQPSGPPQPLSLRNLGQPSWRRWFEARLRAVGLPVLLLLLVFLAAPAVVRSHEPGASLQAGDRLQSGFQLFEAHCVGCHLNGGNVIRRGRTLKLAALERAGLADPEAIARIAAGGVGQMAGYGAALGEDGAQLVADWVWLQARTGWLRPPRMEPIPSA